MSLRTKAATILLLLFGTFALADFGIQRALLYPSFLAIEREQATRNTERAVEALQREIELLGPTAADWGRWDDTYNFIQDRNDAYREANLTTTALGGLKVQWLAFYDLAGQQAWGLALSPEGEEGLDLGELSAPALPQGHVLLARAEDTKPRSGLLNTAAGPMVVVAHPILLGDGQGPARGMVAIGRLLDDAAMARIATQARIGLEMRAVEANPAPTAAATPVMETGGVLPHTAILLSEGTEVTVGKVTVASLTGEPILDLAVSTPRTISERGGGVLRFASASLLLAGGLTTGLLLVLVRRSVLNPVTQLTRRVVALGAGETLSESLPSHRKDEIGVLAREFQRMTGRLDETRQRLVEQSHRAGVAEMASGVLHNIGNAITPVGVKLHSVQQALREAPLTDMAMARSVLQDPETPADQRRDMSQFLDLAGQEVEVLVHNTTGELRTVQSQVDHIQQILADQQRFSRAERVLEHVPLATLLAETVRLLPEPMREGMAVAVEPGVEGVAPVYAARVALQQVFTNLLINAWEAIQAAGRGKEVGRVRIRAREETLDGEPVVHIEVEDNGAGILAEHLPRLFERGFSTKDRGSGMGLHWSANSVNALGGRLYAESDGPGTGARLHLVLPRAAAREYVLEDTQ